MPYTQIEDGCAIRPSFFYRPSANGKVQTPLSQTERRTPFLLLAYNAPREACALAEAYGARPLLIPRWERLPFPVSGHPDMLAAPLYGEDSPSLLLAEAYYRIHRAFWDETGLPIVCTRHPFGDRYPSDIGLNQLVMSGTLYGRLDAAAPELIAAYPDRVSVRQGYARCSVLRLTENAAVTADKGMADAMRASGIRVCLIRQGHIRLEGYDCGFIGGASFALPDRSVCFFGTLSDHPDCEAITRFALQEGITLRSIGGPLTDYGGGILI